MECFCRNVSEPGHGLVEHPAHRAVDAAPDGMPCPAAEAGPHGERQREEATEDNCYSRAVDEVHEARDAGPDQERQQGARSTGPPAGP